MSRTRRDAFGHRVEVIPAACMAVFGTFLPLSIQQADVRGLGLTGHNQPSSEVAEGGHATPLAPLPRFSARADISRAAHRQAQAPDGVEGNTRVHLSMPFARLCNRCNRSDCAQVFFPSTQKAWMTPPIQTNRSERTRLITKSLPAPLRRKTAKGGRNRQRRMSTIRMGNGLGSARILRFLDLRSNASRNPFSPGCL